MLDVAKRAGVSISTVSYVLSGTRTVSEKTKKLIFDTMEELGYQPNALARGLASKRSRIIALLYSVPERGIGLTEIEFVTNAAEAAMERGYHLVLWTSEMNDLYHLRQLVGQGLVDGMILMEVKANDERVQFLRRSEIPFTLIGRCENAEDLSWADIDFDQTTRDVVANLTGLGHTRIAFLNQSREVFDSGYGPAVRAHAGFLKAMESAGLAGIVRFCHAAPKDGYQACSELLSDNPDLTALIAMNDRAIPGVMQAVADKGRRIPEDLSLVSIVSSARAAELFMPPLTTMDVPSRELGRLGVEHLIGRLEGGESEVSQVLVPTRLVERGSTGPRRAGPLEL
jgi:DNA-binding LacI/PurR family transcriptional regulator